MIIRNRPKPASAVGPPAEAAPVPADNPPTIAAMHRQSATACLRLPRIRSEADGQTDSETPPVASPVRPKKKYKPRWTGGYLIERTGVEFPNLKAATEHYGLVHAAVVGRLNDGWTQDEAFEFVPHKGLWRRGFVLPDGMTREILTWATGISARPETLSRWNTGTRAIPAEVNSAISRWKKLGPEKFLEEVHRERGGDLSEIPGTPQWKALHGSKPRTAMEAIVAVLSKDDAPKNHVGIRRLIFEEYGFEMSEARIKTALTRLYQNGQIEPDGRRGLWRAARPNKQPNKQQSETQEKETQSC